MPQNSNASVQLDEKALKDLQKLLRGVPSRFRRGSTIKAFKDSAQPILQEVRAAGRRSFPQSGSIGKSFQVVKGKYARKGKDPYVVIQHRNKRFRHKHDVRNAFTSIGVTNWSKIGHLTSMGTNQGPRRAGSSVRQERGGRKRVLLYKMDGTPAYERKGTSGRYFLVVSDAGRVHPLKTIQHPGTESGEYFDLALTRAGGRGANRFYSFMEKEIALIRKDLLSRKPTLNRG